MGCCHFACLWQVWVWWHISLTGGNYWGKLHCLGNTELVGWCQCSFVDYRSYPRYDTDNQQHPQKGFMVKKIPQISKLTTKFTILPRAFQRNGQWTYASIAPYPEVRLLSRVKCLHGSLNCIQGHKCFRVRNNLPRLTWQASKRHLSLEEELTVFSSCGYTKRIRNLFTIHFRNTAGCELFWGGEAVGLFISVMLRCKKTQLKHLKTHLGLCLLLQLTFTSLFSSQSRHWSLIPDTGKIYHLVCVCVCVKW